MFILMKKSYKAKRLGSSCTLPSLAILHFPISIYKAVVMVKDL